MIGDGSEGIKSLPSMIVKTIIKPVSIFLELDFFNNLKLASTYLLTCFHIINKFSPDSNLIRMTAFELILGVF